MFRIFFNFLLLLSTNCVNGRKCFWKMMFVSRPWQRWKVEGQPLRTAMNRKDGPIEYWTCYLTGVVYSISIYSSIDLDLFPTSEN
jgi:hypothetical protein